MIFCTCEVVNVSFVGPGVFAWMALSLGKKASSPVKLFFIYILRGDGERGPIAWAGTEPSKRMYSGWVL